MPTGFFGGGSGSGSGFGGGAAQSGFQTFTKGSGAAPTGSFGNSEPFAN